MQVGGGGWGGGRGYRRTGYHVSHLFSQRYLHSSEDVLKNKLKNSWAGPLRVGMRLDAEGKSRTRRVREETRKSAHIQIFQNERNCTGDDKILNIEE